jgi:hypothetical protein
LSPTLASISQQSPILPLDDISIVKYLTNSFVRFRFNGKIASALIIAEHWSPVLKRPVGTTMLTRRPVVPRFLG